MKITWEESDIQAGVRYTRPDISETWIIGFDPRRERKVYHSISLSDGMITLPKTRKQFAEDLTQEGYVPVVLLATQFFKGVHYEQKS